jgi:hypothetical protein
MKKAIELLEEADKYVFSISVHGDARKNVESRDMANQLIQEVIALLKAPCWETPEQYEKRTGEMWPDNRAVYVGIDNDEVVDIAIMSYREAKEVKKTGWRYIYGDGGVHKIVYIVCATEAGPPPDDWRPE